MSNVIDMQIVKLRSKLELLLEDREKRIEAINSLKRIISDYKATPPFSFDPRNSVGKTIMQDQLFQYEKTLENQMGNRRDRKKARIQIHVFFEGNPFFLDIIRHFLVVR